MQIKRRRVFKKPEPEIRTRTNERIRIPEVQVIDENGQNLGIISTSVALAKAKAAELDLVEINPKARPSICKIMNYGKYKYEADKKQHKQKVAAKKTEVKGIRLTFKIKGGDLETRQNQARKFLESGNQVKIEMILKGREKTHANEARSIIQAFIDEMGENVKIIQPVQKQGGRFSAIMAPKTQA